MPIGSTLRAAYRVLNPLLAGLRLPSRIWAGWLARRMRRDWDTRARKNALHFIMTGRDQWNEEDFFEAGRVTIEQELLTDSYNICQGKHPSQMRILEIGCGVGRLTRWLGEAFGEVHAVDVSREMVSQARERLRHYPNIHIYKNSGVDLAILSGLEFDFAYSYLVFQHVPSKAIVENYVRDAGRLLRRGGLFKFQVAGRPDASSRRAGLMPNWDTWLGVTFTPAEVTAMADRCGFEARHMIGEGAQYFWLWFFKR